MKTTYFFQVENKSGVFNQPFKINWFWGTCLVLTLGLIPVYIFSSGAFQVVDIPLFIMIVAIILSGKLSNKSESVNKIYLLFPFAIWVVIVNIYYFINYENIFSVLGTIPILYAILIMLAFYNIFFSLLISQKIIYLYFGLFLSIILCFTVKGYSDEGRAVLSFNDPNQLGYFAIFLVSYVIILNNYINENNIYSKLYFIFNLLFILIAHYFLLLSMSRSAIAAFIFLDLCLLKNIKNPNYFLQVILTLLLGILFLFLIKPDFIKERFSVRKDHFEKDTIVEHLEERLLVPFGRFEGSDILFGQGTGQRVKAKVSMKYHIMYGEVHNIFGEILRAFGIIGILLFVFWLYNYYNYIKKIKDINWILAGIFIYNMGIYGIRWRAFWIFISFVLAMAEYNKYVKKLKLETNY